VAKVTTSAYAFLLLGLLFTYPVIWDIFWRHWTFETALEAFFLFFYLCFGFAFQYLMPQFRWCVWSVLLLTLLFVTPTALLPPPFEESALLWLHRAMLACCLFLLVSTVVVSDATEKQRKEHNLNDELGFLYGA